MLSLKVFVKPNPIALVVDSDKTNRRWLRQLLEAELYRIFEAQNGRSAVAIAELCQPDVVILEWPLVDITGEVVLDQSLRIFRCPVLVLSTCDREEEIVAALDSGANGYLTKPFGETELLARLRAILRCSPSESFRPRVESGTMWIDFVSHRGCIDDLDFEFTPIEAALLHTLLIYEGQVVGADHLLRSVWGAEARGKSHYLRVFISGLRRKLSPARANVQIETVENCGYRLHALGAARSGLLACTPG